MRLIEIATKLRDTSARYGGIERYLKEAGDLDRAMTLFLREQDEDSMRVLAGAHARAVTTLKKLKAGGDVGPTERA